MHSQTFRLVLFRSGSSQQFQPTTYYVMVRHLIRAFIQSYSLFWGLIYYQILEMSSLGAIHLAQVILDSTLIRATSL